MLRIILSIVVIIVIVAWVVSFVLKHRKEVTSPTGSVDKKSYVSASVLVQGLDKLHIKHEKLSMLKEAIHQHIVGMDGFINAIIVTLLA